MMRVEIIAHEALETPLMDALVPVPEDAHDPEGRTGRSFTMMRGTAGRGFSGSSFGDHIWPETNITIVLFLKEEEEAKLRAAIEEIRRQYPKLGLAAFAISGYDEWYDGAGDDV